VHTLFDPEMPLWRLVSKLGDMLILSLLWVLLSVPLLTAGAATAALYDATVKCVRGSEPNTLRRFWTTFRREFFTGTLVSLIWGILLVCIFSFLRLLFQAALAHVAGAAAAAAAYFVALLIPVGCLCWMFPLLSRFTFTPTGLMAAGLRFALGYLPCTILLVAAAALAAAACVYFLFPIAFLPCLTCLIWSLPMERIFLKHMPDQDGRQ